MQRLACRMGAAKIEAKIKIERAAVLTGGHQARKNGAGTLRPINPELDYRLPSNETFRIHLVNDIAILA